MASPLELLGINSQTGLGSNLQNIFTQEAQDLEQQTGLQRLLSAQQKQQADALALDTARQTQAGEILATNAKNQTAVGQAGLDQMQQFGERVTQLGGAMKRMPPEQRQQYLASLAQAVPGIAENPVFQSLLNVDPNLLPGEIEKAGRDILLQTGQQMRASALRAQQDDAAMERQSAGDAAAMERARLAESGANGRAAMGDSRAMQLELLRQQGAERLAKMNNEAGRYNTKREANDPANIAAKLGYEKGSVYYTVQAAQTQDPAEKMLYQNLADNFREEHIRSRTAGVTPGMTIDPNTGSIVPNLPMGARAPAATISPQAPPAVTGLPQGTKDNGDGTFTLPSGQRIRRKQ